MAYTIFRKLKTGEPLRVATRDDINEAERLAQSLAVYLPADYSILESVSPAEVVRMAKRSRPEARAQEEPGAYEQRCQALLQAALNH
jgi:hypothetical protein